MTACLIGGSTIDMVLRDRPGPVRLALDAHARPPHRLEPPHMGFGKRMRSRGIVARVKNDRKLTAVRSRPPCATANRTQDPHTSLHPPNYRTRVAKQNGWSRNETP